MRFKHINSIMHRELRGYFNSPLAYLFITVFLVLTSWLFFRTFFLAGTASLRAYFDLLPWVFLFLLPAVTMRLWAEEKKLGTFENLLASPVTEGEAVLGKFFASLAFLFIALSLSLVLPVLLFFTGSPDWGAVAGGYLGTVFLGATYLALGLWVSGLTESQIVSFILSCALLFVWTILGEDFVVQTVPPAAAAFLRTLGLGQHFSSIARGVLDSRDIVYFLASAGFFLYLNAATLRSRLRTDWRRHAMNLLVMSIAVMTVFLSGRHFVRVDLTADQVYALSPSSRAAARTLPDIMTAELFFSTELPPNLQSVRQYVDDLLSEFVSYSHGNFRVRVFDPSRPDDAARARELGLPSVRMNILSSDRYEVKNGYLGLALGYGGKTEILPVIQDIRHFEYDLVTAVKKLTTPQRRRVMFTRGHGEYSAAERDDDLAVSRLRSFLEKNYTVEAALLSKETVSDADTLIVAGPTESFSNEEEALLARYVGRGGNLVLLLPSVSVGEGLVTKVLSPSLNSFLEPYGVQVNTSLVLDESNEKASFSQGYFNFVVPYPFWVKALPGSSDRAHPLSDSADSLVFPWTSPLDLEPGFNTVALYRTTAKGWLRHAPFDLDPNRIGEERPDTGRYVLAALAEPAAGETSGKILVVGSAYFATDKAIAQFESNLNFLAQVTDYLTLNAASVDIPTKTVADRPIRPLSDDQKFYVKLIGTLLMPLLTVVYGLLRYTFRRRALASKLS